MKQQINDTENINIIITIGNSDVQATNQEFFKTRNISLIPNRDHKNLFLFRSPFHDGKKIQERFEQYSRYLDYPIIEMVMNYINNNTPLPLPEKIKIFLISTYQNTQHPKHKSDTYYYAEIIKKHLHQKHHIPLENIINVLIKNVNLIHYDEMFTWFNEKFKQQNKISGRIYLVPQGGIDAINFNLMLFLIRKYPDIKQLYISEQKQVSLLNFPNQILFYSYIQPTIQYYNYDTLLQLPWLPNQISEFTKHIRNRLLQTTPSSQNYSNYPPNIKKLLQNTSPHLWTKTHIYIHYVNDRIPIAILLLYAHIETLFDEKILQILKEKIPNIPQNNLYEKWKDNYKTYQQGKLQDKSWKQLFEELHGKLKEKQNKTPIKEMQIKELTIPVKYFIIQKYVPHEQQQIYHQLYKKYENIRNYRNKFAHNNQFNLQEEKKYKNIICDHFKQDESHIQEILNQINTYIQQIMLEEAK